MLQFYYTVQRHILLPLVFAMLTIGALQAQQTVNPFNAVLTTADVKPDFLKAEFPKLSAVISKPGYTMADINNWLAASPKEWNNFIEIPTIKKLNIAWATLGITVPASKAKFEHSLYQWYTAAQISDEKRKQLFPHFPLPDLKNEPGKELTAYDQKVATWQRLYPEEYERFLNTPELTALNPYYTGYYKLPYMPKFIGQAIDLDKPQKQNTGNAVMDEYNYQLKLRNWYFIFKPQEFDRLFGKDYKFPDDFDAKTYREYHTRILTEKKKGTYPDNNSH